jgi:acyl-CoA synthetase (AMP-forming)/AMP-acid ligase II
MDTGELRVRGPGVFREYLGQPAATAAAFDAEGWFCTGDIARYDQAEGMFQILGRASVDIVKTGGHKVSALEVERAMLEHARVAEAVVLGVVSGGGPPSPPPLTAIGSPCLGSCMHSGSIIAHLVLAHTEQKPHAAPSALCHTQADLVWGERLVALVRLRDHARTVARSKQEDGAVDGDDAEWLRTWLRGRVASEKVRDQSKPMPCEAMDVPVARFLCPV